MTIMNNGKQTLPPFVGLIKGPEFQLRHFMCAENTRTEISNYKAEKMNPEKKIEP